MGGTALRQVHSGRDEDRGTGGVRVQVMDEMIPALEKWEAGGRWDTVGVNDHVKTPGFKWAYP